MTTMYEDDARADAFFDDVEFEERVIKAIREERAYELARKLRKDFPSLVRYCPHVKKMLEAISCPEDERYVYEPVCWKCQREGERK